MLVPIRRRQEGIVQGISLSHLVPGLSYDLDPTLARYLIAIGAADGLASKGVALVVPIAAADYGRALGGVSVTQASEAADKPRRKRRPKQAAR
jgi:hypothetical protein